MRFICAVGNFSTKYMHITSLKYHRPTETRSAWYLSSWHISPFARALWIRRCLLSFYRLAPHKSQGSKSVMLHLLSLSWQLHGHRTSLLNQKVNFSSPCSGQSTSNVRGFGSKMIRCEATQLEGLLRWGYVFATAFGLTKPKSSLWSLVSGVRNMVVGCKAI